MSEVPKLGDRRKALMHRQSEVNYTTVSPFTGESQCANCRRFIPSGTYSMDNQYQSGCACSIVENYPLSILPTGYCDRYEALPADANEPESMMVVVVEEDTERGYIAPLPVKPNALKRLFGYSDPPATTFYRAADGARLAIIFTSNGYKDREDEHVATKALAEYVASQFKGDTWQGDNVLDFYHWHSLDIGDIAAAAMLDGFLVEVAKERIESPLAVKVWDYWEETAQNGSVVWGASHEFAAKRDGDTFIRIKKTRTSILDIEDAANLYTYSGVLSMVKDIEHLDKTFGFTGAAELLRDKGPAALNEELKKRGNTAKGIDKPGSTPPPVAAAGSPIDWTPLLTELIDGIGEHQKRLDARDEQDATRQKSADTQAVELKTLTTTVKTLTDKLDTFLSDSPRKASEDPATALTGTEEEKAKKDIDARTTQFDPTFGDMHVPLSQNGAK